MSLQARPRSTCLKTLCWLLPAFVLEIKDTLAERGAYVHPVSPREAQAFVRSQQELWKPALDHIALQFKER